MKYFLTFLIVFSCISAIFALECFKCDSDDRTCISAPTKTEECDNPQAKCATYIQPGSGIKGGKTVRGCVDASSEISEIVEICLCGTDKCNKDVCPKQRLQCYHCEGNDCNPNGEFRPCLFYEPDDQCYAVVENDGKTYRGCLSDSKTDEEGTKVCTNLGNLCQKGLTNDQPSTSTFECVKCESSSDDPSCALETKPTSCENVLLGREAQCYTIATDDKISRGCHSEPSEIAKCTGAGENCKKCSTAVCNIEPYHSLKCQKCEDCSVSNPGIDEFCYVSSDKEQNLACYHKVEDDVVSRGCLSALPVAMQTKCLENNEKCKICREPSCNSKNSFQECYRCNSQSDPNCAKVTSVLPKAICESYNDKCAIWLDSNGVTHRDCQKFSPENIFSCSSNLCNGEIFPINRLQCHQCDGQECSNVENDQKITCQNYDPVDQCFVVVDDQSGDTFRGCMSDVGTIARAKCDEINEFCITGLDNSQPAFSENFECVKCRTDSLTSDDSCARKTETNSCGPIPLGRSVQCYTLNDGDHLVRDCYFNEDEKNICDESDYCEKCDASGCNVEQFRTLECRKCSSDDKTSCKEQIGKEDEFGFCLVPKFGDDELACYRREEGNVVVRGCLNTIREDILKKNCEENFEKCKICQYPKCNDKIDFQRCFACDSSINQNCATLVQPDALPRILCPGYFDLCAVSLTGIAGQDTFRSCISNKTLECPNSHCDSCTNNYCNNVKYPQTRQRCHRCTEESSPDCVNNLQGSSKFLHFCPKYDKERGDVCFGVIDNSTGLMIRGCRTDFELFEKCQARGEACIQCNYSEGCNNGEKLRDPTLSCINCEPSNLLGNCQWGSKAEKATGCQEKVAYGETEQCFTTEYGSDVARRGCLNDFPMICDDPNVTNCTICNTKGCNNENIVRQECVVCDSNVDLLCRNGGNGTTDVCTTEIQEFNERWCYTMVDAEAERVTRGCFMHLTEEQKARCEDQNDKSCQLCHDFGCNNKKASNSGRLKPFSLVFVLLAVIILKFSQ